MSFFIYKRQKVRCPFCRRTVATVYHELEEVAVLPSALLNGRVAASSRDFYKTGTSYCQHTAFFCYWGYIPPEINPPFRPLLEKIAAELELDTELLEERLAVFFNGDDEETLVEALETVSPKSRARTENICLTGVSSPQWNQDAIVQALFIKAPAKELALPDNTWT